VTKSISEKQASAKVVLSGSQAHAMHEMACLLGGAMFQQNVDANDSALMTRGSHQLSGTSLRDTITATIIREEAAESLLPGISGDAELAALTRVLNRYNAQWWLKHLSSVGADPAWYWSEQLGAEIKAARRGQNSTPTTKKISRWSFRNFMKRRAYELFDLDLHPL
jgi:hypothetical protein